REVDLDIEAGRLPARERVADRRPELLDAGDMSAARAEAGRDRMVARLAEPRARDPVRSGRQLLEMLRGGPAAVVHHQHDDRTIVADHGVERGDGEADRAVAGEAEHWPVRPGGLGAEREPKSEADRAEEAVGEVGGGALLADRLVEPVIGLGAVADHE